MAERKTHIVANDVREIKDAQRTINEFIRKTEIERGEGPPQRDDRRAAVAIVVMLVIGILSVATSLITTFAG